jgi:transposase
LGLPPPCMTITAHILEPTSILVNRRARRAKTDRLDAEGMLRALVAWLGGDQQVCSIVRVPTPNEEDAKRPHREREHLIQERLRIENRIEALLFTQGIRGRPSLRSWERDMAELRTGDGRALPPLLRTELDRLRRRLVLTLELIRELEAERATALEAAADDATLHPRHRRELCRRAGAEVPSQRKPPVRGRIAIGIAAGGRRSSSVALNRGDRRADIGLHNDVDLEQAALQSANRPTGCPACNPRSCCGP